MKLRPHNVRCRLRVAKPARLPRPTTAPGDMESAVLCYLDDGDTARNFVIVDGDVEHLLRPLDEYTRPVLAPDPALLAMSMEG